MSLYHKILVPLDASDLSDSVLDTALATAAWSGAEVVLLRVQKESPSYEPEQADIELNVIDREIEETVQRALDRLGTGIDVPSDRISGEVRSGNVADAIVAAAEELMADAIVMGTHGRKGITEMFTGSTTEQVTRRTPASVFVVRPKGYPYLTE